MLTKEQKKMIEDNLPLCYEFTFAQMKRSGNLTRFGIDRDDLLAISFEAMCRTVKTFDPARGYSLSTLFYRIAMNDLRMEIRKTTTKARGGDVTKLSLDLEISENGHTLADVLADERASVDRPLLDREIADALDFAMTRALDDPLLETVDVMCFQGMTQIETAERLGVTQSAVSRRMKSAREKLTVELKKLGYAV